MTRHSAAFIPPISHLSSPQPPSPRTSPSKPLLTAAISLSLLLTPTLPTYSAPSPLLDLEHIFTTGERTRLESQLEALSTDTGIRVYIVTQTRANAPGTSIKSLFPLSEDTILLVYTATNGNALGVRVGENILPRIPQSFWTELVNRYGNNFYIREHGPDGCVKDALAKIIACSQPGAFCKAVPGVDGDQYRVGVVSAMLSGCIAGAAARTGGRKFSAEYVALFSPLWGIFLVSFAIGPLLQRVPGGSLPLAGLFAAFGLCAGSVWWWVPRRFGSPGKEGEEEEGW